MSLRQTLGPIALAALALGAFTSARATHAAERAAPPAGSGLDASGNQAKTADALFAVLDADGNGQIDRAEWQTQKMAIFYKRDVDNDMQLTRGELPGVAANRFDEADLNKDGVLSGYEFNQAAFSQFDKADPDSDGKVNAGEFHGYMAAIGTAK